MNDGVVYGLAMLLFSALPILSMMKSRGRRASEADTLEPGRLIAVVAFCLLLWLQLQRHYILGVLMVGLNLTLRLFELVVWDNALRVLWMWTTQPRQSWRTSIKEAAVLTVVFGLSGSSSVAVARELFGRGSTTIGTISTVLAAALVYYPVLLGFGTLAGRYTFFSQFVRKRRGSSDAVLNARAV